jgi:hypothetical protein
MCYVEEDGQVVPPPLCSPGFSFRRQPPPLSPVLSKLSLCQWALLLMPNPTTIEGKRLGDLEIHSGKYPCTHC